jgi:lipooligosaccharide transport system permease protein
MKPIRLLSPIAVNAGARLVARRNAEVFFTSWNSNLLPPLLEPILWILALGYGLGSFVDAIGDQTYVQFLAPALLGLTAMNSSFFECSYGSFVRMHYQKTYQAITATPIGLDDVVLGEFLWAAVKSALNATIVLAVLAAFGLVQHWALLLAIPIVAVAAFTFGAIGILTSALAPGFDAFNYPLYLYITPMFFLSGTFFPLDQFPQALQFVAYTLPLTHAVLLSRALAAGVWGLTQWASLAWLIAVGVILTMAGVNAMKRRLIK